MMMARELAHDVRPPLMLSPTGRSFAAGPQRRDRSPSCDPGADDAAAHFPRTRRRPRFPLGDDRSCTGVARRLIRHRWERIGFDLHQCARG